MESGDLLRGFRSSDPVAPASRIAAVEAALNRGQPLVAIDLCNRAEATGPAEGDDGRRLNVLRGIALARAGAPLEANLVLEGAYTKALRSGSGVDREILGMVARTLKDLWRNAPPGEQKRRLLEQALSHYRQAHFHSRSAWTGVNVAALQLAAGNRAEAEQTAAEVIALCESGESGDDAQWTRLSDAECRLVLGDFRGATRGYAAARAQGIGFGRIASARRNASLVLDAIPGPKPSLEEVFPAPRMLVFAGHRIDSSGRHRFPQERESEVRRLIGAHVDDERIEVGIASAADGADILFHEVLVERGLESHVVLPSSPSVFRETSVTDGSAGWHRRFESVLANAASVTQLTRDACEPIDFLYANYVVTGLACLKQDAYGASLAGLAVWNPETEGGVGGTTSAIQIWRAMGIPVRAIHPLKGFSTPVEGPGVPPGARQIGDARIASLLFADAQGFSKLSHRDVGTFTEQVLGPVGRMLDGFGEEVLCRNSWGDAVYVAFGSARAAAECAHRLVEVCDPARLRRVGLPGNLGFRISLHAGPIRVVTDPISGAANCIGSHVSWAARIEPVTPAHCVYASEAFSALCRLHASDEFECAYVGEVPLAKEFGTLPTYRVRKLDDFPATA